MYFGFEGILGTFVAGIVVGVLMRGDRFEHALHAKLRVIGFGVFVPAFFVTSGLRFQLGNLAGVDELARAGVFFVAMVAIHTVPTFLYRPHLSWRECLASGLMQSTNLSFIVVAVTVGTEMGELREINAAALVMAGLASAIVLPALASTLLGGARQGSNGVVESA